MVKKIVSLLITSVIHFSILAQDNIKVEGVIIDGNRETLPYTAVSILSKYIGTVSNDDGAFLLKLKKSNLNDTITVSTLGYKTFKIKVLDYINLKNKVIVLEEDSVSL